MERRSDHGDKPAAESRQSRESPQEKRRRIERISGLLEEAYPDARLALHFKTPLELLIALILAAQCTDERVNQVTAGLFRKYRTPQDWAAVDPATLEAEIRSITFYRNKAKIIQKCCADLVTRFSGKVPQKLEDLLTLPGVGRKTANILRGNVFDAPAIGVDTHVGRLAQRLGLSRHTDPDKIEFDLNPLVPDSLKVRFCHLLQAHGRAVCLSRKPNCPACIVNALCPYPRQFKVPLAAKQ
jgi:endonuclease-3